MISRRALLAGGAAALTASLPARAQASALSLGEAAAKAGLLYGASIAEEAMGDPACRALYLSQTAIVTTDVALKFDWLRPSEDVFDFSRADAIVDAAHAAGKLVRGHTLIWNDNTPAWLRRLSGREVERVFDAHIEKVVSRYAGRLHSWDVVNEPFWPMAGLKGGWRDGPWFAAMGPAYVERAFRRVASIDRAARLTLNEAQCDNDHEWGRSIRPPLAQLVERLVEGGVPLHAIGFESHLQPQWPANYPAFAEYARGFAAKGLDIYLTELDINDASLPDDPPARDEAVAAVGARFLDAALKIPAVKMVVNWQICARYSWYRDLWRRGPAASRAPPRPLPYAEDYKPTALRAAMIDAFLARAGA